ncbi:histone H3.v1-like [Danio aesculapii]|uniref:histone H3.v1-like n=1 Tax=Danio aesculapii TaxID=1142201 RepID=UPI0024BF63FE|nr:histone H3.v1-like [Danio aesculapii]
MSQYNTRKKHNLGSVEGEVNTTKPIKQEILMWQNTAEVLQNKVHELEALNSELRQQVVELSMQQQNDLIPGTSVGREESSAVDLFSDENASTDVESSVTDESCDDTSSSSSSEETREEKQQQETEKEQEEGQEE